MDKYNVYIVEIATGKAVSLIGSNLSEDRADQREMTGLQRIDRENFFVGSYEVGSETDTRLASDLKSA